MVAFDLLVVVASGIIILALALVLHLCLLFDMRLKKEDVSRKPSVDCPSIPTPINAITSSRKRKRRSQQEKLLKNRRWRVSAYSDQDQNPLPKSVLVTRPCQSYQCCATCCHLEKNICRGHGTGSLAIDLVESARINQVFIFDLSYAYLRKCPLGITQIGDQLTSLNLSNNQLSSLPGDIGCLVNLEELFLQYNSLFTLPDTICQLRKLVELDAKNNSLSAIPGAVGNMKKMQILNLTNNSISYLPSSIGMLQQLEELSLHSNNLRELPKEICNASSIRIVYAGENYFKTLPSKIGWLARLEELDLSGCDLEYLPESLSQCRSLEKLWLSNNRLSTLPHHIGNLHKLKELHIRNNVIKYFPASIQRLQLYTFTAQNNALIKESAAKTMLRVPSEVIAPLLELAARAVLRHQIPTRCGSIPQHLEVLLESSMECTQCEEHLFSHYSAHITYATVGFYYKVPLYLTLCSFCDHESPTIHSS